MEEAEKGNYNPCCFLKEAVNAVLKCLGFESSSNSKTQENCSEVEEKKKFIRHEQEQSCPDEQSCSSSDGYQPMVPPSTQTDPPETTNDPDPLELDMARRGRTPPRPPVRGGRDPQTNSIPSL